MRIKVCFFAVFLMVAMMVGVAADTPATTVGSPKRTVIILKLDDLTSRPHNDGWQRCLDFLSQRQIKCSAGIIGYSLEGEHPDYFSWIKEQQQSGRIEFWCHGFMKRSASDKAGEFEGTYEMQKAALEKCQRLAQEKLGFTFKAFGPHWSNTNAGTVRALREIPEFTTWMYGNPKDKDASGKYIYPRYLALEHTTFVPDVERFKEKFEKLVPGHDVLVLQGHPMAWGKDRRWENFVAIIDFLQSRNCEFMTVSEYYEQRVLQK